MPTLMKPKLCCQMDKAVFPWCHMWVRPGIRVGSGDSVMFTHVTALEESVYFKQIC